MEKNLKACKILINKSCIKKGKLKITYSLIFIKKKLNKSKDNFQLFMLKRKTQQTK